MVLPQSGHPIRVLAGPPVPGLTVAAPNWPSRSRSSEPAKEPPRTGIATQLGQGQAAAYAWADATGGFHAPIEWILGIHIHVGSHPTREWRTGDGDLDFRQNGAGRPGQICFGIDPGRRKGSD